VLCPYFLWRRVCSVSWRRFSALERFVRDVARSRRRREVCVSMLSRSGSVRVWAIGRWVGLGEGGDLELEVGVLALRRVGVVER
jgi:hypothetical protein